MCAFFPLNSKTLQKHSILLSITIFLHESTMYAYIDDEDVAFKMNMEQCVRLVPAVIAFSCAHHLESTFYTATFGCDSNCV